MHFINITVSLVENVQFGSLHNLVCTGFLVDLAVCSRHSRCSWKLIIKEFTIIEGTIYVKNFIHTVENVSNLELYIVN